MNDRAVDDACRNRRRRYVFADPLTGSSAVSTCFHACRELDAHLVRPCRALDQGEEGRRAVDHRETGFDPVVANGHFAAVDLVAQRDARCAAGGNPPAILAWTSRRRARVQPAVAVTASTWRSYSRIRYEPGVHVAM